MSDNQEWLRKWIYRKGYKGAGVSDQLRQAMRGLNPSTHLGWWRVAENAMQVIQRGDIVGLFGDFGRGKSLMGAYLALEFWCQAPIGHTFEIPPKPKMIFASQFLRQIQASWKDGAETSEKTLLDNYRNYPLVVIDEVHERGDSEWASHLLISVVKQRESRQLPTVLITNETPKQYADGPWGSVMDRIVACQGDFVCEWENLRRLVASKATGELA